MAADERLTAAFEAERARLVRVAYATLGALSEAEDVVQEAWVRLDRVGDPASIRDPAAWLTTTVSRLALDALGSARSRREQYVGPWLPEPLVADAGSDPADRVTLDETVGMALLVVLERLSPAERTAFLLHDVFGLPFDEVAEVVGRSPAATRQLAARARRHVEEGRPRFPPTRDEQLAVVQAFGMAVADGDLQALLTLLDPDVVWTSDGGGLTKTSRVPQHGADKVGRAMVALGRHPPQDGRIADVNGAPGIVTRDPDGTVSVFSFTLDAGRIVAIDIVRNPYKLHGIEW